MNGRLMWVGYSTIVRKEITRILRIWGQTIVPPAKAADQVLRSAVVPRKLDVLSPLVLA